MIYTQKELYEKLKTNPLSVDVFFAQDTIAKSGDFIIVSRINDNAKYCDDEIYLNSNNIQFAIYCEDIDDLNQMIKWFRKEFNVTLDDENQDDFYYIAYFQKSLIITDW